MELVLEATGGAEYGGMGMVLGATEGGANPYGLGIEMVLGATDGGRGALYGEGEGALLLGRGGAYIVAQARSLLCRDKVIEQVR